MSSIIVRSRPNSKAALRLFCFPYAGGRAGVYRDWAEHVPPTVEICAVELPGRGTRLKESPFTRLAPLVESLVDSLQPAMDRSFAFFGHSMGALLSFELARFLRRQGRPGPRGLFVSAARAPQLPGWSRFMHDLPEPELIGQLGRLNGTPEIVLRDRELMEILLPVIRADLAACETYRYDDQPPLECGIAAFGGLQDTGVKRERLEAWSAQTASSFSLHMVPGDHFFLHTAQPLLLQMLSSRLQPLVHAC